MPSSFIAKLEWRQDIPAPTRESLLGLLSREKNFDVGQDFKQNDHRQNFCSLIAEGFAARYKLMSNGRRQITALHLPGDFVDLHTFLVKGSDHDVMALSPCRVLMTEHEQLQQLTMHAPEATRLLWMDTLVDAAIQREWLVAMGRRSALGHLSHLICELFLRLKVVGETASSSFRLPLTQSDVADVLGLSMVHVNRMLKKLRSDEVMVWNNQMVSILDWGRLVDIAEFDPSYLAFRPGLLEAVPA
ncbi:MAG: Crp/Fnr family transcriptional regulator [Pararhizobium sp.]